jgi:hypothetical protein
VSQTAAMGIGKSQIAVFELISKNSKQFLPIKRFASSRIIENWPNSVVALSFKV